MVTYFPIHRIEACGRKHSSSKNGNRHAMAAGTKVHISMTSTFPVSLISFLSPYLAES
jgi:hypothetical protein